MADLVDKLLGSFSFHNLLISVVSSLIHSIESHRIWQSIFSFLDWRIVWLWPGLWQFIYKLVKLKVPGLCCTGYTDLITRAALRVHLWDDSVTSPWCISANLCSESVSELPPRHLQLQIGAKTVKGSSKIADGSANDNWSFNCKWQLPMEATILKNPFYQSELFF